jgi:hypothetical protein
LLIRPTKGDAGTDWPLDIVGAFIDAICAVTNPKSIALRYKGWQLGMMLREELSQNICAR